MELLVRHSIKKTTGGGCKPGARGGDAGVACWKTKPNMWVHSISKRGKQGTRRASMLAKELGLRPNGTARKKNEFEHILNRLTV